MMNSFKMIHSLTLWIRKRWRLILVILVPVILLPLPILQSSPPGKCGYVILILTIFWIVEVIPLPVTSLLPLILFPTAGVLKAEVVAPQFFQEIIALFFGSLSLAYAIEAVNLHRRVGLFVLSKVGGSSKWSMAGLMIVTAFLSMWINNSAATSIMLPVALAVAEELEESESDIDRPQMEAHNRALELNEPGVSIHLTQVRNSVTVTPTSQQKQKININNKLKKGFLLAVAYSATIGGLATLVGTAPNIFVKGFVEGQYKTTKFSINFGDFFIYSFPISLLMLIFCWIWLQITWNRQEFFTCKTTPEIRKKHEDLKLMLAQHYAQLGKLSWNEYWITGIFLLMVILWVTKDFSSTPGWSALFVKGYIGDSTVAVFCGILPLIIPDSNPFRKDWNYQPIISWNNLVKNISWGALMLLGAGLSVATAFRESGLSKLIADTLAFLSGIPENVMILIVIVISGVCTEVTSNLSTVSIFLPVLDSVARSSEIHPGLLLLPCTLAVSLAFMLPIATPPNAIIFASGTIKVIDMIKTGIVMNIIGMLLIYVASITWMKNIYHLDREGTLAFYANNITLLTKG